MLPLSIVGCKLVNEGFTYDNLGDDTQIIY